MLHHFQQRGLNQAGLTSFVKIATYRNAPPSAKLDNSPERANTEETPSP
jgi:hypothetical protein